MRQYLVILAVALLLGGCVAVPAPDAPASRGITGDLSGNIKVAENLTVGGTADIAGTLNYGANDLYPLGHATSGKAIVASTVSTAGSGHATITHGLTSVDSVLVSLCQGATTTAAFASAIITSTTVTLNAWDSTLSNRVNGVSLCYLIIGER